MALNKYEYIHCIISTLSILFFLVLVSKRTSKTNQAKKNRNNIETNHGSCTRFHWPTILAIRMWNSRLESEKPPIDSVALFITNCVCGFELDAIITYGQCVNLFECARLGWQLHMVVLLYFYEYGMEKIWAMWSMARGMYLGYGINLLFSQEYNGKLQNKV